MLLNLNRFCLAILKIMYSIAIVWIHPYEELCLGYVVLQWNELKYSCFSLADHPLPCKDNTCGNILDLLLVT